MTTPRVRTLSPGAVLVDWPALTDAQSNERALAHAAHFRSAPGVLEAIPAARSLLLLFESRGAPPTEALASMPALPAAPKRRVLIPMRYDGLDAGAFPVPKDELKRLHQAATYRVAFIGFAPGFPYLEGLHEALQLPRLATPRAKVPAGSVAIAGRWCGVYPSELPGGWNLIGRTGRRMFDPAAEVPSLLAAGDEVQFEEGDAGAHGEPPQVEKRPALRVLSGSPASSVQGGPRFGWGHFGAPPSGAFDLPALEHGNALLGNPPGAAGLELTVSGMWLEVLADTRVVVTGSAVDSDVSLAQPVDVRAGEVLKLGRVRDGARAYLCVEGGLQPQPRGAVPAPLRRGDVLNGAALAVSSSYAGEPPAPRSRITLRVLPGPHEDRFTMEALRKFSAEPFTVAPQTDRLGVRVVGPKLAHVVPEAAEVPPEGNAPGAVQVPGNGLPIILGPDRPVTGGYAKIATVVPEDLPLLGQLRPGDVIRFAR
jgi:KipI family sensor histidine kinase inhibitor